MVDLYIVVNFDWNDNFNNINMFVICLYGGILLINTHFLV